MNKLIPFLSVIHWIVGIIRALIKADEQEELKQLELQRIESYERLRAAIIGLTVVIIVVFVSYVLLRTFVW